MLRDLFSLFPAYAGVIPPNFTLNLILDSFPRIRGGDPKGACDSTGRNVFSPHTRG